MGYQRKTENPKMGRPKVGDLTRDIRVRVDEDTYKALERIADVKGISMSEVSRKAIKEYLRRNKEATTKTYIAYKVRTTFLGADGPSEFYFSTEDKAKNFLAEQGNGEVEEVKVKIDKLPSEGCTWADISYWMNN